LFLLLYCSQSTGIHGVADTAQKVITRRGHSVAGNVQKRLYTKETWQSTWDTITRVTYVMYVRRVKVKSRKHVPGYTEGKSQGYQW